MTGTTLTYHCPSCGAGLSFDPAKGKFCCEYCLSEFTEPELSAWENARKAEEAAAKAAEAAAEADEVPDEEFCSQMGAYSCASCGAEIMADDNTAADICPYCHNPILMTGRLSGQMKPQKVIPFRFDKENAQKRLVAFAKKKRFLPRDFLSPTQLDRICGIYYPFWVTDADVAANMTARATRVHTWRQGDYRYTKTSKFHISRMGEIHFEDIVTPAITEEDREMLDGILPYPSDSLEKFSMPYLSGFVAKKRNIEKEAVREAVKARMMGYAKTLLSDTISGYTTVTPSEPNLLTRVLHWDYTLMPIWLLTYHHKGRSYTFAMNGYTGKVWGRFPVSGKKLAILGTVVGITVGVVAALLKLFVFR